MGFQMSFGFNLRQKRRETEIWFQTQIVWEKY